jgi:hypothetical protein
MANAYTTTLENLEFALDRLTKAVPPAEFVEISGQLPCWRYRQQLPEQAVVIKLARLLSALHAAKILLDGGLVLDVGASKRILDEMVEDVLFIVGALRQGESTPQHERFLKEFWQEEFDNSETDDLRNLERDRVPRKKIRSFNARLPGVKIRPEIRGKVQDVVGKTYSGYIHGAAAHTMEIYGGEKPRFHPLGMRHTPPWLSQAEDLKNYFYRSVCVFGIVAGAFCDQPLLSRLLAHRSQLEKAWGMTFDDVAESPQTPKST